MEYLQLNLLKMWHLHINTWLYPWIY